MSAQARRERKDIKKRKKRKKLHDFLLFLHNSLAPYRKTLLAGSKLPWKIRLLLLAFDAVIHTMFTKKERENMSDATIETKSKP